MGVETKNAVCLMSGGLDSAVTAAFAQRDGFKTEFLFVDYGQKTSTREARSARSLAFHYGAEALRVVKLPWLKDFGQSHSGLFDRNVELTPTNSQFEYVPFRNTILLSVATALAEVSGADRVYIGSTGSDRICPDNSPEYLEAFQQVMGLGTMIKRDIQLTAPLSAMDKKQVVETGLDLNVPFEKSWSCHNATRVACGNCSNCVGRVAAFQSLGVKDPLPYRSPQ